MKKHNALVEERKVMRSKIKPTQILLTFEFEEIAGFIKAVCRRKGYTPESYIVDNFEWDDMPECLSSRNGKAKITHTMCYECEYYETCPDAIKK